MTDWPRVRLGEVCEFKYGKSLPAIQRSGGDVPVYGSNGVVGGHDAALTTGPTIVVGRKGSYGEINLSEAPCWPIDTTYYIDKNSTTADLGWLAHMLPTLGLTTLNRAAAIPGLNREDAYRQTLLLPPLPDQRRIAAILDQADELRAKRRRTLALHDDLTQSIFLDMFGNVMAWLRLESVVDEFRYGTSNKSAETGDPALRIPNVVGGSIDVTDLKTVPVAVAEFARLQLRDGDLLFVRTNGNPDNVGRCAVFAESLVANTGHDVARFIYASYLIRARLDQSKIAPAFLAAFLQGRHGRKQLRDRSKTSAGQYNINIDGLSAVQVPEVPLELQREFVRRVESVRAVRRTADADQLDELFASLQSRAFSGRL